MLLRELLKGLNVIETNADLDCEISAVCSDTGKITKGCAFVCIKGMRFDAHRKAGEAVQSGAAAVICQSPVDPSLPYVMVKDTRQANALLHSNFSGKPQDSFRWVIGLTGTNGKTSTSYMIKAILEEAGYKTGLVGTMKYLVGDKEYPIDSSGAVLTTPDPEILFPLLSEMKEEQVEVLIMEASSHALKLNKLAGIRFDVGIFTNLTQDHLDFHEGMEDYLASKQKLFAVSDLAVVNYDDPGFEKIVKNIPCDLVSFSGGENNGADFVAKNVRFKGAEGVEYELLCSDDIFRIRLPIPGQFSVNNSLAAAACALKLGVAPEVIVAALARMDNVKGRIERVKIDAPYSVFIDFAHTPDALENVIRTLRQFATGRIITLFGCGGDRDRKKRPLMGSIAAALSDYVVVTSDNSRSEEKKDIIRDILEGMKDAPCAYKVIEDRSEAIRYAMDIALEGDVILLAGKGHEEYEIDKNGKRYYSEREVVCDYYGKKG